MMYRIPQQVYDFQLLTLAAPVTSIAGGTAEQKAVQTTEINKSPRKVF